MKETLKMTQVKFEMAVSFMPASTERIPHVHSAERLNNSSNNTARSLHACLAIF